MLVVHIVVGVCTYIYHTIRDNILSVFPGRPSLLPLQVLLILPHLSIEAAPKLLIQHMPFLRVGRMRVTGSSEEVWGSFNDAQDTEATSAVVWPPQNGCIADGAVASGTLGRSRKIPGG